MGRRVIGAVLCSAWLLSAAAAPGRLQFGGAEPEILPVAVESVASGDLDRDGNLDAVFVSASGTELLVVLAAERPSRVSPPQSVVVGAALRRATVSDLNGDSFPDVAVADLAGAVWILIGRGDGTFLEPRRISVGSAPSAVDAADFDGRDHRDLVVADMRRGSAIVLLNDGAAMPAFRNVATVAVGDNPDAVLAIDVDRDARPDIVTLNVGSPRVQEVAISRLREVTDGVPHFAPVERANAGEKPSQLLAAELTGDGAADLALLNRRTGEPDDDLTVLVNDGTGHFTPMATPVRCPFFTGGIPCRLLALAAGDFDRNNHIDLAVAVADPRPRPGSAPPADALQVLAGRGDGRFLPGPVFALNEAPTAIAAGNMTSDCLPDLIVASSRDPVLQVLVNASTGGLSGNGEVCTRPEACISGLCTDGHCCATACATGERCDFAGSEGLCRPIPPPLRPCTIDRNCPEAGYPFCADGVCCDDPCPTGRCDLPGAEGLCIPGAAPGVSCGDDRECESGFCRNFRCCREDCLDGFCDAQGLCHLLLDLAAVCQADEECRSGVCDAFDGICCNRRCDLDSFCDSTGRCHSDDRFTVAAALQPRPAGVAVAASCSSADCDGDSAVSINELIRLIALALGTGSSTQCPSEDPITARCVSIDDIVLAVKQALGGCQAPGAQP